MDTNTECIRSVSPYRKTYKCTDGTQLGVEINMPCGKVCLTQQYNKKNVFIMQCKRDLSDTNL